VEEILAVKKGNPKADTGLLEKEVDKLVFELYGLTEERKVVLGG
jgi:adenine-specific DNA-methyltransferase